MVVAIDAKRNSGGAEVFVTGGRKPTGRGAIDQLIFAVDSRNGRVVFSGWRESTSLTAAQMMRALNDYCSAFLYTHVDTEGSMRGFPATLIPELQSATTRRLIVAGGIRDMNEVNALNALGVDAVVGMAIYTHAIEL